jgi:uncharacterized membrane protein YcaP (DUF421 family)
LLEVGGWVVFHGWFDVSWSGLANVALRSAIVYVIFLVGLRLFGKREVGQFTFFDLALVLLLANALQPAMTGPDTTVGAGLVIVIVLFLINLLLSRLRLKSPLMRRLVEGHPTVIAQQGAWLQSALRHEGLDEDDAMMALREHGIDSVKDVQLAVMETDGSISVVPADGTLLRAKRRHYRKRS